MKAEGWKRSEQREQFCSATGVMVMVWEQRIEASTREAQSGGEQDPNY